VSYDGTIERPLPHSLEAERAILGAVLLGGTGALEHIDSLQATDFFLPQHQVIFRHIKRLRDLSMPTDDPVLLYESLEETGELEAAGNAAYISNIPDGLPRVTNLVHYVQIVRGKSRLRRNAYIAEAICEKLLNTNGNAEDVLREVAVLSAPLREEVEQKRILKFTTGAEIAMQLGEPIEWIVPGFVVRGESLSLAQR
jgi:replicative DNA helicase